MRPRPTREPAATLASVARRPTRDGVCRTRRRVRRSPAMPSVCAAIASMLTLAGCGSTPTPQGPPWMAAHPDPAGLHFADAEGICAVTVRYPNDAPGEIDYGGAAFIQRDRVTAPASPGRLVGRSGDWTIYQPKAGSLLLTTSGAAYTYLSGSNCGSNAAPPS